MAATKNLIKQIRSFDPESKEIVYLIGLDTSYVTGGEEVNFVSDFPNGIDTVIIESNSSGYVIASSIATRDTKFPTGKCDFQAFYGNYDAVDGPLIEVPNATNLSAVFFYVIVRGPALVKRA